MFAQPFLSALTFVYSSFFPLSCVIAFVALCPVFK
uniref:Uncharacterized protein n=1 Tax=Anguilla anguilla TaxID=7936 RepID=A0A0E9QIT2_ANGAN